MKEKIFPPRSLDGAGTFVDCYESCGLMNVACLAYLYLVQALLGEGAYSILIKG